MLYEHPSFEADSAEICTNSDFHSSFRIWNLKDLFRWTSVRGDRNSVAKVYLYALQIVRLGPIISEDSRVSLHASEVIIMILCICPWR